MSPFQIISSAHSILSSIECAEVSLLGIYSVALARNTPTPSPRPENFYHWYGQLLHRERHTTTHIGTLEPLMVRWCVAADPISSSSVVNARASSDPCAVPRSRDVVPSVRRPFLMVCREKPAGQRRTAEAKRPFRRIKFLLWTFERRAADPVLKAVFVRCVWRPIPSTHQKGPRSGNR